MHNPDANLVCRLTAPGTGAIAVVRVAGPLVESFLDKHFSKKTRKGASVHGELREGGAVIDDPVVTVQPSRQIADLHLHGGEFLSRKVMEIARAFGFELVDPLPLPLPEFAVDGETVREREIQAYLPLAKAELAIRALLAQEEAWQGVMPSPEEIRAVITDRWLDVLLSTPTVAIIGAPNVGKSTIANQLFGTDRSIAADLPGTTRDWVGHEANINGLAVMLVDTPGIRVSGDAIEQEAIARSQSIIRQADRTILILDPTREESSQRALITAYPKAMRVLNKSDQHRVWQCDDVKLIETVATTGKGIDELRRAVLASFDLIEFSINTPRCWTQRQREILTRAQFASSLLSTLWR